MILWAMRLSAKLNVFLGVPNLAEEFLPEHLHCLKSFLTKKPMNLLFPVSVTVSTLIAALLVQGALAAEAGAFQATGLTLLAVLLALAILEHWFLVLPLPDAALWSWALRARAVRDAGTVRILAGLLGAGHGTLLRRPLAATDSAIPNMALANAAPAPVCRSVRSHPAPPTHRRHP